MAGALDQSNRRHTGAGRALHALQRPRHLMDAPVSSPGDEAGQYGECQKPGALRRELDRLVAEASVQHCGPDLEHAMGAAG